MLKLAIDLLWVRPSQVGGTESYIRNLLNGLLELKDNYEIWLLVSRDNEESFSKYGEDKRIHIHQCNIASANVGKRIIWQNFYLGKVIKNLKINKCFEPYYAKPFLGCKGITFFTTIHDLQALHYPEYFSKAKVAWMKRSWRNDVKTSKYIITTTNFVNEDISKMYSVDKGKTTTIYIPISINKTDVVNFEQISNKYGVNRDEYYFTVSSLLPHKNLETVLTAFAKIDKEKIELPCKWIISGVGGESREKLQNKIDKYGLKGKVVLTPFISNTERNTLYANAKAFLFPSIFEGFGMPPLEAMYMGTTTITTRKTSLEEVTQGAANYVENPLDPDEWIEKMLNAKKNGTVDFSRYDPHVIARQYLDLFSKY